MGATERISSRACPGSRRTPPRPAARHPRTPAPERARLQRCACGGGCPRCRAKASSSASSDLPINEPGDAWEREVLELNRELAMSMLQLAFSRSRKWPTP